jgi:hypothetical protein
MTALLARRHQSRAGQNGQQLEDFQPFEVALDRRMAYPRRNLSGRSCLFDRRDFTRSHSQRFEETETHHRLMASFSTLADTAKLAPITTAKYRELRASLLISLDMQIDLHVVSNDPRSLNHLVPG